MTSAEGAPAPEGGIDPQAGTVVQRTGLAVVHQGERILTEEQSRAVLQGDRGQPRRAIEIVFPVEIEVRGAADAADLDRLADLVLRRLTQGMLGA